MIRKIKQRVRYKYNGMRLIEYCRQTGLDYRYCCRQISSYRNITGKEMPVEEAVKRTMNKKPSIKQQLLDAGVPPEKFSRIYNRVCTCGWSIEKAISTPVGIAGRPRNNKEEQCQSK